MKTNDRTAVERAGRLALLLTGTMVFWPAAGHAQTDPSEVTAPITSQIRAGQYVRLTAPGVVIDGGRIEAVAGDTLLVAAEGLQWAVQASLLESMSVRESRVVRSTVIGAVPGAALGVFGKILINKMDCSSNRTDCPPSNLSKGVLIGAGLGSVIGFIVGKTSEHWRQVVP
ncbi:MAG: hypothetical protein R3E10_10265 [Gemmatimonadota bacterium]